MLRKMREDDAEDVERFCCPAVSREAAPQTPPVVVVEHSWSVRPAQVSSIDFGGTGFEGKSTSIGGKGFDGEVPRGISTQRHTSIYYIRHTINHILYIHIHTV